MRKNDVKALRRVLVFENIPSVCSSCFSISVSYHYYFVYSSGYKYSKISNFEIHWIIQGVLKMGHNIYVTRIYVDYQTKNSNSNLVLDE
jgi:hypothetical protein